MICLNNSNTNIVKVGLFYINATKNISFFSSFGTNKLTLVQGPLIKITSQAQITQYHLSSTSQKFVLKHIIGHGGLIEFPIRTKLELCRGSSTEFACHVCFQLAQWFRRNRLEYQFAENYEDVHKVMDLSCLYGVLFILMDVYTNFYISMYYYF